MSGAKIAIAINDLEMGLNYHHQNDSGSSPEYSYHDDVVGLKFPHRESLYQFMDPKAEGFAMDLNVRMNHFDIKIIHFPKSGEPISIIKCTTPEEFKTAIGEIKNIERTGTIIIAKGLSRAMIEALGIGFDLQPEFFASHLGGTELFRLGQYQPLTLRPPAREPVFLPEYIKKAPFYTVEFRRPHHIEGGHEYIFKLRATETTTPRGIHITHNELPDVFVHEKISVYKKKNSNIGIILTDQLLSTLPPASHLPSPVTSLSSIDQVENTSISSPQHEQISTRRELITYLQHLPPSEVTSLFSRIFPDNQQQFLLSPILHIVHLNGTIFLFQVRHIMNRILTRHCDERFPDSTSFFLHVSRSFHRIIVLQQQEMSKSLRVAFLRGCDDIAEQEQEFGFLAEDLQRTLEALKEDVRYLIGEVTIQEGKIVGWVSKFAALFLPVSLLATILGIQDSGYEKWAVLGGLSGPFVLILIYVMWFWKPAFFK